MINSKNGLLAFIAACLFAALPLAHAQNAPDTDDSSSKAHTGQRFHEIFSHLHLTDAQKQQLEMNKQQYRARMQGARQAIEAAKDAIRGELMKPQLDMPKINAIHNRIKALQSQMEDDKLTSILAVRSILTPDQFLKFVNLMHKHKQNNGE